MGPVAVIASAVLSVILAVAVRLHGPSGAWWVEAAPLAILGGMSPVFAAILTPKHWWRR